MALRTYRTPDGERFANPADLLAVLTERRTTAAVPRNAVVSDAAVSNDAAVSSDASVPAGDVPTAVA